MTKAPAERGRATTTNPAALITGVQVNPFLNRLPARLHRTKFVGTSDQLGDNRQEQRETPADAGGLHSPGPEM
jgi:hypothetical protein